MAKKKLFLLKNSRFGMLLLLVVLVFAALYFFRSVILPFAVAAFLAYLLAPVINKLIKIKIKNYKIRRGLAVLIVYAMFIGFITIMGLYLTPRLTSEFNGLVKDLPTILKKIEQEYIIPFETGVNEWLAEFVTPDPSVSGEKSSPADDAAESPATENLEETLAEVPIKPAVNLTDGTPLKEIGEIENLVENYTYLVRPLDDGQFEVIPRKRLTRDREQGKNWEFSRQISSAFQQFRSGFENNILELIRLSRGYLVVMVSSFFTIFLVLMISAFLLLDPERMHKFIRTLVPESHQDKYMAFLHRLDYGLSGVVRGQVMICLINGVATGIGIAIIGVPFVFTLTLIATVFSLIPVFGVLISTIPIMLLAITVSFSTAIMALVWVLLIHFIEANFLNPKILGDSAKIHPVLIIFALVAGQSVGGIMGALVAVPIFSLVQNSFLFLKSLAEEMETAS